MESRKRSIAKALSWRIVAVLITAVVAYVVTGKLTTALEIGIADTVIKLGVYYLHERTWLRLPYGKAPPPEYQI